MSAPGAGGAGGGRRGARSGRIALQACAAWQIGVGARFIALRPSLLPEDLRFSRATLAGLRAAAPQLELWLQWVFTVLGGQMAGTGLLLLIVARRATAARWELPLLALAALATSGLMSGVNFAIGSDFRFLLLLPVALWGMALLLLAREGPERVRKAATR